MRTVFWAFCLVLVSQWVNAEIVLVKQNSAPKYFSYAEKKLGLCDDFYVRLGDRLQRKGQSVRTDQERYPIKRVLALLEAGKAHVFCGAGRNKKREALFHYSKDPVYFVSNVVLAHQDEGYIPKDYKDLAREDLVIGAYFGTTSASFLRKQEGVRVMDNITTLDDAMEFVASKHVRYFYYHDLGLGYLVSKSDLPIKLLPTKFRTVPQWLLYSRALSEAQIQLLDTTLGNMIADGELAAINAPYFATSR